MEDVILRGSLKFTPQPLSAWAYLLFIEKSQDPKETLNARAVGTRLAQGWLYSQAYELDGEELTEMKLTQLQLTLKEANQLLVPLSQVMAEVDILDDVETIGESKHFKVNGHEYEVKPIPWEAADRWLADIRVSLAQAYKNMIVTYITRDGDRIAGDMLGDSATLGIEEGKVLFEVVKYAVN